MEAASTNYLDKYSILSLDGGGSWALIQVMALQKLYGEQAKGREVLKQFDLVVVNSGGSITAMAMAEDWTLEEILNLYRDEKKRKKIFVQLNFFERRLSRSVLKYFTGVGPKYKTEEKLAGFRETLSSIGDCKLKDLPGKIGESSPHFLICAFDYDRERAIFFRSDTQSKAQTHLIAQAQGFKTKSSYDEITVAKALHASSNAPLNFFDAPAQFKFGNSDYVRRYWDGAVGGYNNPVMAGLTEALSNGIQLEDIRVLSLGTGNTFLPLKEVKPEGIKTAHAILCQEPDKPGLANDIAKISTSILSDPPDAATFTAYTLLHANREATQPRLVRMNPLIRPLLQEGQWVLPQGLSDTEFDRLVKLEMDAVAQEDADLIYKFCRLWLLDKVPNQPIRSDGELQPILGHGWFSEAKQAAEFMAVRRGVARGEMLV